MGNGVLDALGEVLEGGKETVESLRSEGRIVAELWLQLCLSQTLPSEIIFCLRKCGAEAVKAQSLLISLLLPYPGTKYPQSILNSARSLELGSTTIL